MDIAGYIDHTVLAAQTTPLDIDNLCKEALEWRFAAVCVNPVHVQRASAALRGSAVKVATVCGFPLGANTAAMKLAEAALAIKQGASEIDMVMAIGLFKGGETQAVGDEIAKLVEEVGSHTVKVIIETCLLTPDEIALASRIAADNGAAFVKTSTGFGSRGASIEDVEIMKKAVAGRCLIKASGGIRTREQAIAMINAGASRIGTSAGVAIVTGH